MNESSMAFGSNIDTNTSDDDATAYVAAVLPPPPDSSSDDDWDNGDNNNVLVQVLQQVQPQIDTPRVKVKVDLIIIANAAANTTKT